VYEDKIMESTKHLEKGGKKSEEEWKYNGGIELVQGTLNAWMELSQWIALILLMYANSKTKFKKRLNKIIYTTYSVMISCFTQFLFLLSYFFFLVFLIIIALDCWWQHI
jgi:hypothetical protein